MKKYKFLIEGKNFLINIDGQDKKVGFFTTRYVEAENSNEAELSAISLIKNDPKLKDNILNTNSDPPAIILESVSEVNDFGTNAPPAPPGFSFYLDEGE